MSTLLDIGARLAAARRASGTSQRALGDAIGVKQQQIARWEATSYRTASLARVAAVADALGFEAGSELAAEASSAYGAPATASALTVTPARDLGEVAARLRAHAAEFDARGIRRIGVFGSFALGEQTPVSDIDLLVDYSRKPAGLAYMDGPDLAETVLGRPVDWVEPHLLRDRLRDRVLREVVYVWDA
jgi:predicted nucleotidyltransferase/DNA-binding XRE family transcriptional regulator